MVSVEIGMAKDDKGGASDKDKKAAIKSAQDIQGNISDLRDLHSKLGKHLDDYDKNMAGLLGALQKDNEAEQQKRFDIQTQLQTKIFGVAEDITRNKEIASDRARKALESYIKK